MHCPVREVQTHNELCDSVAKLRKGGFGTSGMRGPIENPDRLLQLNGLTAKQTSCGQTDLKNPIMGLATNVKIEPECPGAADEYETIDLGENHEVVQVNNGPSNEYTAKIVFENGTAAYGELKMKTPEKKMEVLKEEPENLVIDEN